jgi:polysaccharide biosynthesis protein PslH
VITPSLNSSSELRRRRILYLTHRVPHPPNRGDRIRSYHVLRYLSTRADVDLACLADEEASRESRDELQRLCQRVAIVPLGTRQRWWGALAAVLRGRSATEGLFHSSKLQQVLHDWAARTQYDAVLAFCSSMAPYFDKLPLRGAKRIVDLVDVDSQKWADYADNAHGLAAALFRLEARRVRKLEGRLARACAALTVVSTAEADLLRSFAPQASMVPVGNGVDLETFRPGPLRGASTAECVFVGALDYRANVDGITWFCREVWPQVHAKRPDLVLRLVGRRPAPAVRRLSMLPQVQVIGDVAEVVSHLHRARLAVIPLRVARGIQNKVLEAMAAGTPVIASPQALEGLNLVPTEHAYQADTPEQWENAISRLLTCPDEWQRLATAGRDYVCQHHRWSTRLEPLGQLLGVSQPDIAAPSPVRDAFVSSNFISVP